MKMVWKSGYLFFKANALQIGLKLTGKCLGAYFPLQRRPLWGVFVFVERCNNEDDKYDKYLPFVFFRLKLPQK